MFFISFVKSSSDNSTDVSSLSSVIISEIFVIISDKVSICSRHRFRFCSSNTITSSIAASIFDFKIVRGVLVS